MRRPVYIPVNILLTALLASHLGCSLEPTRIFQAKVPPPLIKAPAQIEIERAAADLIARKIEKPTELIAVAQKLSVSLGSPATPINEKTLTQSADSATQQIDAAIVSALRRQEAQNLVLQKYQGKEIEGTGLSLLGPGVVTILIALAALGVLCPPALTLLGFAFRRLKSTAGMIVESIDQAAKEPEAKAAVQSIKTELAAKMDLAHKKVVHALQKPVL